MSIESASGNKYVRTIQGCTSLVHQGCFPLIEVDVYAVLKAFDVASPARQHALKKLLCAGLRNKGSEVQDLREARDALDRDIEMISGVVETKEKL